MKRGFLLHMFPLFGMLKSTSPPGGIFMENEEKIGFFKRIGIAMTNPKDYHKIAKQSAGKSIGIYFIDEPASIISNALPIYILLTFIKIHHNLVVL